MGIWDIFKKEQPIQKVEQPEASYPGVTTPLFAISYNGEKNTGELGLPTRYHLDYRGLRTRSWQSYLDNEITQTVIKKYVSWIIGGGLKLQSEPVETVLKTEGISLDANNFTKTVEDRFRIYCDSKVCDHSKIMNLNKIAYTAYTNAIVGGDVLVVLRLENKDVTIQLIDGGHIKTPLFGKDLKDAESRGNTIKNGIETSKNGEHIAFHVVQEDLTTKRIKAKSTNGHEMAFMVYGLRYRIDDNRGIPIISTVLETLQKLDRYKEATVGSAEERAKIPYSIEHDQFSTGENPMAQNAAKAFNIDSNEEIPTDINGKKLADNISVSMGKTVYNMPIGAKLKATDTKSDINFNDFYAPNVAAICSTIGIPPEVALSKYDSNFSASRAALKDWEHTISVARKDFGFQFYQKVYSFWLEIEILKNKIQAPGFLNALSQKNWMALEAYRKSRFVGANVPHIDPVKEVKAERLKLGSTGEHIPLTTAEAATEALNGGDYESNIKRYSQELQELTNEGIEPVNKQEQPEQNIPEND